MPSPPRFMRLLQLAEDRGEARRVVGQAGGARELRRIDAAGAREELAEHVAELVFGVLVARLVVPIGHVSHLHLRHFNRSPGLQARVWEMA